MKVIELGSSALSPEHFLQESPGWVAFGQDCAPSEVA